MPDPQSKLFDDEPPWDGPEDLSESDLDFDLPKLENKVSISPTSHYFREARKMVDQGREGKAIWIPLTLNKVGKRLEISPATYTLVGGAPGSGKTAFVHQMYILAPYVWWRNNKHQTDIKLKIILRNMERKFEIILVKWVAFYLYAKYKKLVDTKFLIGRGQQKNYVSDELYVQIREGFEYFEEMMSSGVIDLRSRMENPTGINKHIERIAKQQGKEEILGPNHTHYVPDDDNLITLIIIDHIGRIRRERGFNDREVLQKMSEYLSIARDRYGFSPVVINQFNRAIYETSRRTSSAITLVPEERDFKGAANMFEDADVAIGMFDPGRYGITKLLGYDLSRMRDENGNDRFRSIHVLKNNLGMDKFDAALHFVGENGTFAEMPPAETLNNDKYYSLVNLPSIS